MSRMKSAEKNKLIIEAAKSLFLEYGFACTSMDRISENAGVSKNTLYSHYKNKSELFSSVLKAHWNEGTRPSVSETDKRTLEVVLKEYASALMKYLYRKDTLAFFRVLAAESDRFPDIALSIVADNKAPMIANLAAYLTTKVDNSVNTYHLAIYFFGLLKEGAFWLVLTGFRKPYAKKELDAHIDSVVRNFSLIINQSV